MKNILELIELVVFVSILYAGLACVCLLLTDNMVDAF